MVMLFTDGLYEVQGRNEELYSQAMLVAGVQRRAQLPAPQLFDELLAEIGRFSIEKGFADDVCLVGMEYAGMGYEGATAATNSERKALRRRSLV
jgi:sigma-B regulation protein RsbU (phosphoserine phosphatase)